jgi:hypothetical protein
MTIRLRTAAILIAALNGTLTSATAQAPAPATPTNWPAINSQIGGAYPIDELEHTLTFTLESASVATRFASAARNRRPRSASHPTSARST